MQFASISPFVRYAEDVYIPCNRKQVLVNTYDHRLFYVVSGQATIEINNTLREVGPGCVLYWMSGTSYLIRPVPNSVLHVISVNFDFTQDNSATVQFLPMTPPQEYNPKKRMENIVFADAAPLNNPIVLQDVPAILPYLRAMLRETSTPQSFSQFQQASLMRIVLTHIYREASQRQSIRGTANASRAILDYIHGHFSEDLNNKKLAEMFGYHPNYISQLISEHTGVPLHQYLLKIRIRQALYLLQTTEICVSEIAHQVGFKSTSYFSQYFKQCTGHSPKEFRIG